MSKQPNAGGPQPTRESVLAEPHHRIFWTIDTTIRYDIAAGRQALHGDILVQDGKKSYQVRGYAPGRISPFDPRARGYTLFAGVYSQVTRTIVQSRGRNKAAQKTRVRSAAKKLWESHIPLTGRALVLAGDTVLVAGMPVVFPPSDLGKAYEGRAGGVLWAVSATTGEKIAELRLESPPTWDGMAVANGRLYIALQDGRVLCLGSQ